MSELKQQSGMKVSTQQTLLLILHNCFHTNRCFQKHLREMAIQSKPLCVYKYFYLKHLTPGLKYAVKILLSNADGFSQVVLCRMHTGSSWLKLTVKIVFAYCTSTQETGDIWLLKKEILGACSCEKRETEKLSDSEIGVFSALSNPVISRVHLSLLSRQRMFFPRTHLVKTDASCSSV